LVVRHDESRTCSSSSDEAAQLFHPSQSISDVGGPVAGTNDGTHAKCSLMLVLTKE